MKSNIFLVAIFLFIGGGIYMFTNEGENSFFDFSNSTILPKNEWEHTLIGRWNIDVSFTSDTQIHRFTGDVEYKNDTSFIRYVTMKFYKDDPNEVKEEEGDLKTISGGSVEGKWKIADEGNFWIEETLECNGQDSYQYLHQSKKEKLTLCNFFIKGNIIKYGEHNKKTSRHTIKAFNKDQIVMEAETFDDGGKRIWTFTRKD